MDRTALIKDIHYTYDDYYTWTDNMRCELIRGVPRMMSPAPIRSHQEILLKMGRLFGDFLEGKKCQVYIAPFDVRLNADTDDDTVVQPDLVVVCDRAKLDKRGCVGAPDMVAEILSPSTARHDKIVKRELYRQAGVREYWIIDPDARQLRALLLEGEEYTAKAYGERDHAPVSVLEGLVISLADVFEGIE